MEHVWGNRVYWATPAEQLQQLPAFPNIHKGLAVSITITWYSKFQDELTLRRIPRWAALFNFTEYSLRIGTATAWVEAGGEPSELQHLGGWATRIGNEVYARMSVERALHLQEAALSSSGMTLDSLLQTANTAAASGDAVFVQGVAQRRANAGQLGPSEPPVVRKRSAPQSQQQLRKFMKQLEASAPQTT